MPVGLKIITGLLFLCGLPFFVIFIPRATFSFKGIFSFMGTEVPASELWTNGGAYLLLTMAAVFIISAIGIIKRQKWSRYLCLVFIVTNLYGWTINNTLLYYKILEFILNYLLPLSFGFWYLFKKEKVVKYFESAS